MIRFIQSKAVYNRSSSNVGRKGILMLQRQLEIRHCGDQQILQPGPGEIRQYYYIYSPVCSRLFNRIQLHIPQLLYW